MEEQLSTEEAYGESDKKLARGAWSAFWNGKSPAWATLGVIVTFTIRPVVCDYDPDGDVPEGMDFEWYGNHCGPGHGDANTPAIDELDAYCKEHDAEYRALAEKAVKEDANPPIKE